MIFRPVLFADHRRLWGAELEDPENLQRIIEGAVDLRTLNSQNNKTEGLYAPNQTTPYTGWVKKVSDNGQILILGEFKEGQPNGETTTWFENGQKHKQSNFIKGRLPRDIEWYKNGKKKAEAKFTHGKLDGLSTGWDETGRKQWERPFQGQKAWPSIFYNQGRSSSLNKNGGTDEKPKNKELLNKLG